MTDTQKVIKIGAIVFAIFIITSMINGIFYVTSLFTDDSNNNTYDYTEKFHDIDNIDFNISASNLIIKKGTEFKIETINAKKITTKIYNKNLTIKDFNKKNKKFSTNIILYIPENYLLNTLFIKNNAGSVDISEILINDFTLKQVAGTAKIKNSDFSKISIDNSLGDVRINNSNLNDLNLKLLLGDVDIDSEITGSSIIKNTLGDIKVHLKDKEKYTVIPKNSLGSIRLNNDTFSKEQIIGEGSNKLQLSSILGDIDILFK